jgi:hypothetical protein
MAILLALADVLRHMIRACSLWLGVSPSLGKAWECAVHPVGVEDTLSEIGLSS